MKFAFSLVASGGRRSSTAKCRVWSRLAWPLCARPGCQVARPTNVASCPLANMLMPLQPRLRLECAELLGRACTFERNSAEVRRTPRGSIAAKPGPGVRTDSRRCRFRSTIVGRAALAERGRLREHAGRARTGRFYSKTLENDGSLSFLSSSVCFRPRPPSDMGRPASRHRPCPGAERRSMPSDRATDLSVQSYLGPFMPAAPCGLL